MKRTNIIFLTLIFVMLSGISYAFGANPKIVIKVEGSCVMCKTRIEEIAMKTQGVIKADWNIDNHMLTVYYTEELFRLMDLHQKIAEAGHDTELVKASDEVYNSLPECCQYRAEENVNKKTEKQKAGNKASVRGRVYEIHDNHRHPLLGASIYLQQEKKGFTTDENGYFGFESGNKNETIIVSYIGYKSDTFDLNMQFDTDLEIVLNSSIVLDEVEISHKRRTSEYSYTEPIKVQKMSVHELKKAACCNLSESFETNPSVDVNYTDAVTGSKVIELLGLAGKYVQITRESMPYIRGLASIYGMAFTPGPWIEGIQMIKGTGSVVNGFESMTGQINLEFFKPETADPLFVNLYAGENGRYEANINVNHKFNEMISTGLLVHGSMKNQETDHNKDGFLDEPIGHQFSIMNRWDTYFKDGVESKFGVNVTGYRNIAGQKGFISYSETDDLWGAKIDNDRVDAFFKIGKVFNDESSVGFQSGVVSHKLRSSFGKRNYNADQKSFYTNLIYQQALVNDSHILKSGVSFQFDRFDETFIDNKYKRDESVPGIFSEYSFIPDEKFTLVAGLRADWNNYYGFFFTPRLNLKYSFSDRFVLRAAAGRGQRTANIFAENTGMLASSRSFVIDETDTSKPYGLKPEVSWNLGLNLLKEFRMGGINSVFSLDYYHSSFSDQVLVDIESPMQVSFYNLEGKSYSNSLQALFEMTIIKNFDIRLAYRFNDVKSEFKRGLIDKPLSSRNRAFVNLAYKTGKTWKFDYTVNWQGRKRLPAVYEKPSELRAEHFSPDFLTMNLQVTKIWKDVFELYAGAENLLDYKQHHAIYGGNDPFGPIFDSSLIWGPVMGRNIYVGLRYNLKKK
ncbi:MAG: TonB-dependent receptor domain-containing protein [Deltaproteobacteria bacterium]